MGRSIQYPQEKLEELYAAGGIEAVVAHYGMSVNSARVLLTKRGIHEPREYIKQDPNPFLDKAIRLAYQSGDMKNVRMLAEKHRVKFGWIKYRAGQLGIRPAVMRKESRWTEQEINLLTDLQGYSPTTIQRRLKAAGFLRTQSAIVGKIRRFQLDTARVEGYTANEVARLLGLSDCHVIIRWINSGWLVAEKRKYITMDLTTDPWCWFIMPGDLQDFIIENISCIDFTKLSQNRHWFISILTEKNLPKLPKRRARG